MCSGYSRVEAVHLVLFNLTVVNNKKYHDLETSILPFFKRKWKCLQGSSGLKLGRLGEGGCAFVSELLLKNKTRFKCGSEIKKRSTFWGLRKVAPPSLPGRFGLFLHPSSSITVSNGGGDSGSSTPTNHNGKQDGDSQKAAALNGAAVAKQLSLAKKTAPSLAASALLMKRPPVGGKKRGRPPRSQQQKQRLLLGRQDSADRLSGSAEHSDADNASCSGRPLPGVTAGCIGGIITLDSFIPPPKDFEGFNNPFRNLGIAAATPCTAASFSSSSGIGSSLSTETSPGDRKSSSASSSRHPRGQEGLLMIHDPSKGLPDPSASSKKDEDDDSSSLQPADIKSYFGAFDRIVHRGERFGVAARRLTMDGDVQFLIEWDQPGPLSPPMASPSPSAATVKTSPMVSPKKEQDDKKKTVVVEVEDDEDEKPLVIDLLPSPKREEKAKKTPPTTPPQPTGASKKPFPVVIRLRSPGAASEARRSGVVTSPPKSPVKKLPSPNVAKKSASVVSPPKPVVLLQLKEDLQKNKLVKRPLPSPVEALPVKRKIVEVSGVPAAVPTKVVKILDGKPYVVCETKPKTAEVKQIASANQDKAKTSSSSSPPTSEASLRDKIKDFKSTLERVKELRKSLEKSYPTPSSSPEKKKEAESKQLTAVISNKKEALNEVQKTADKTLPPREATRLGPESTVVQATTSGEEKTLSEDGQKASVAPEVKNERKAVILESRKIVVEKVSPTPSLSKALEKKPEETTFSKADKNEDKAAAAKALATPTSSLKTLPEKSGLPPLAAQNKESQSCKSSNSKVASKLERIAVNSARTSENSSKTVDDKPAEAIPHEDAKQPASIFKDFVSKNVDAAAPLSFNCEKKASLSNGVAGADEKQAPKPKSFMSATLSTAKKPEVSKSQEVAEIQPNPTSAEAPKLPPKPEPDAEKDVIQPPVEIETKEEPAKQAPPVCALDPSKTQAADAKIDPSPPSEAVEVPKAHGPKDEEDSWVSATEEENSDPQALEKRKIKSKVSRKKKKGLRFKVSRLKRTPARSFWRRKNLLSRPNHVKESRAMVESGDSEEEEWESFPSEGASEGESASNKEKNEKIVCEAVENQPDDAEVEQIDLNINSVSNDKTATAKIDRSSAVSVASPETTVETVEGKKPTQVAKDGGCAKSAISQAEAPVPKEKKPTAKEKEQEDPVEDKSHPKPEMKASPTVLIPTSSSILTLEKVPEVLPDEFLAGDGDEDDEEEKEVQVIDIVEEAGVTSKETEKDPDNAEEGNANGTGQEDGSSKRTSLESSEEAKVARPKEAAKSATNGVAAQDNDEMSEEVGEKKGPVVQPSKAALLKVLRQQQQQPDSKVEKTPVIVIHNL